MSDYITSPRSRSPRRQTKTPVADVVNASVDTAHAGTVGPPKPVLSAKFNHRVMINFKMSSRVLAPLLPAGIELLPFRSAYYVTFMATNISGVKVWGLPIFPSFNAIALRTYVRSAVDPKWVGAFTLRRYVSSSSGAWLLKKHLGVAATVISISRDIKTDKGDLLPSVAYRWTIREAKNVLSVKARSQVSSENEKSKNRWMLDHLNEFSVSAKNVSVIKAIKPVGKAFDVSKANFKCSANRMFGEAFVKPLAARPASVYLFNGGSTKFLPSRII